MCSLPNEVYTLTSSYGKIRTNKSRSFNAAMPPMEHSLCLLLMPLSTSEMKTLLFKLSASINQIRFGNIVI